MRVSSETEPGPGAIQSEHADPSRRAYDVDLTTSRAVELASARAPETGRSGPRRR
jgi:hypothetical protein